MKKKSIISYDLEASQAKFESRDGKKSKIVSIQELISKK